MEAPRRQGHNKDKGAEMRMSLAGSRTARRPLRPGLHGPGDGCLFPILKSSVAFSLETQGAMKVCVIELIIMIIPFLYGLWFSKADEPRVWGHDFVSKWRETSLMETSLRTGRSGLALVLSKPRSKVYVTDREIETQRIGDTARAPRGAL